jgi:hypothetical protein
MLGACRADWHRALAALALCAVWASVAAGLWTGGCGPAPARDDAPAGPAAYDVTARHGLPGPPCEIRAVPAGPVVALASVVEALPALPPVTLAVPLTAVVRAATRDTIPSSRVVDPLQHPPNLAG